MGAPYLSMDNAVLNWDPHTDLVMTSPLEGKIAYLETSPEGVLELTSEYTISNPSQFGEVLMIDFNLDGLEECLLYSESGIVLYLQPQGSSFNEIVISIANELISGITAADLDGDGLDDLILTTLVGIVGGGNTYVMTSAGNTELTLHPQVFPHAQYVKTTDIGSDGDQDLYLVSSSEILILENLGGMDWQTIQIAALPEPAEAIAVGEILLGDPDGNYTPDLLLFPMAGDGVHVFPGTVAGTIGSPSLFDVDLIEQASEYSLANLEGQGTEDLLYLNGSEDKMNVLRAGNSVDGIPFSGVDHYNTPSNATCLSVADYNRDGALDVAVSSESLEVLVIYHGRDPEANFSRGDVNRDGFIDIADPVISLHGLFQGPSPEICMDSVDCNDDGMVDLTDPILLLSFIFSGGAVIPEPVDCDEDLTEDLLDCSIYQVPSLNCL